MKTDSFILDLGIELNDEAIKAMMSNKGEKYFEPGPERVTENIILFFILMN